MSDFDISTTLISDESIRQKLPSIFVDSIVVDQNFNVIVISQNVLDFMEFSHEEVNKKNINYFAGTENLVARLRKEIAIGYFEEKQACLFSKSNRPIRIGISGFYLGLISDINGYIILKIRNLDEVEVVNHLLRKKTAELDNFIYRAAHDLRGPLATMKGLINLLKIRVDSNEIDRFILLLDAHANKLDERLYQLVYLAQADQEKGTIQNTIDFSCIETTLRKIIEQNAFVDFLEFNYSSPQEKIEGVDGVLLSSLLSNTLLYLLSLQMNSTQVQLFFRLSKEEGNLKITIAAQGFETSPSLRSAIQQGGSIYTDMIHYPQLMNFYAAQKIVWQLNAKMKVHFLGTDKQRLSILLPLKSMRL
jgi:signal transduction histidine kinase